VISRAWSQPKRRRCRNLRPIHGLPKRRRNTSSSSTRVSGGSRKRCSARRGNCRITTSSTGCPGVERYWGGPSPWKGKGQNNRKCGNKYLAWAFVEAANFARRYDEQCRRWYDRKAARTSTVIATKALACKLAKAAWHVMAQNRDYDPKRMLPDGVGRAAASQVKGLAKSPQD
jgi:hypothetical protein